MIMYVPVFYTVSFQLLVPIELIAIGKYGAPLRLPTLFPTPCFFNIEWNAEA